MTWIQPGPVYGTFCSPISPTDVDWFGYTATVKSFFSITSARPLNFGLTDPAVRILQEYTTLSWYIPAGNWSFSVAELYSPCPVYNFSLTRAPFECDTHLPTFSSTMASASLYSTSQLQWICPGQTQWWYKTSKQGTSVPKLWGCDIYVRRNREHMFG